MSPGDRCDQVIRLIDEVLDEQGPAPLETRSSSAPASGSDAGVEEVPGHWGVFYLHPTA